MFRYIRKKFEPFVKQPRNYGCRSKFPALYLSGTVKRSCFINIEDEQGQHQVVFPQLFDKYRRETEQCRLLVVKGVVQKNEMVHISCAAVFNYTKLPPNLTTIQNDRQQVLYLSWVDKKSSPFIPMAKEQ